MNKPGTRKNLRLNGEGSHSTPLFLPHSCWVSLGSEVMGCLLFNGKPKSKFRDVQPQFTFPLLPVFNTNDRQASSPQRRYWVHICREFHCYYLQSTVSGQKATVSPDQSLGQESHWVTQIATIWIILVVKFVCLGPQKS